MSSYFNGKVVWITGASSGIGEFVAYALSARGAKLVLSARRQDELERVKNACVNPGAVQLLVLDLADANSLDDKAQQAIACFGQVDIMVHNGGITQRSLVAETDMEVYRRIMEVNFFSYVALTRALLPHFLERKAGHFVVTSSVMGKLGTPMRAAYAASKHALHGFFDCLRAEVTPDNIKVTILTPGYIATNISLYALTKEAYGLGVPSNQITGGLSSQKAAEQIVKAIEKGRFEAYIGKFGKERLALWVKRTTPNVFTRIAVGLTPK